MSRTILSARCRQNSFYRPTTSHPSDDGGEWDSDFGRPFACQLGFASELELCRSMWRSCHRLMQRPLSESFQKAGMMQPESLGPLGYAKGLASEGNKRVGPRVPCLHFARGPSAIFGGIWAVIVDAIYRMVGRSATHVGKKQVEHFPSFADIDTAPPVLVEAFRIRVSAALHHLSPNAFFLIGGSKLELGIGLVLFESGFIG